MINRRNLFFGASALLFPSVGSTAPVARTSPGLSSTGWLNVCDFGARGDGLTIDSPAIQKAIEAASKRGGGTIYFPPGTYASFTLRLKSNVTLFLDQGAILLAASVTPEGVIVNGYDLPDPQDPAVERFQDFGHNHWSNSLIWGEGLHNVAILGQGMIWGKGLALGHSSDNYQKGDSRPGAGNKCIGLKNCFNVQLRDFRVLEGGWFVLLATGVDSLTIDNLLIDTVRDGLDIDCCRNVRVTNCTINSPHDDAIVPKSSMALGYMRPTENVMISDCYLSGNYVVGSVMDGTFKRLKPGEMMKIGRIKLGTESNGGFKNITISNCVFDECRGLALETVDGAILEDVTITNITMRGIIAAPLFLRLGARMRAPQGTAIGSIKRVLISNITSSGASRLPSIIAGIAGHPIEDIKISNLFLEQVGGGDAAMAALQPAPNEKKYPEPDMFGDLPASGFFIRNARNIELDHVEVATRSPDARPAYWLQDVDGFSGSNLRVPSSVSGMAFSLDRVSRFRTYGGEPRLSKSFETSTTQRF